jgi:5-formyltetrahydrofolate cyclo-ligase
VEADVESDRKAALRAATLAARRALRTGQRDAASRTIVERLLGLPELRDARVVLLYAALSEEADVGALVAPLHERDARTVFPRVRGDRLELVAASDLRTLQLGYRGIQEPVGPAVEPATIEAVLVPGVAFDPHGGRLGQGGGHYDRLLAALPEDTVRVGVCFACQVVPDVPREAHDLPVDVVVSDRAVYRTNGRA